jgi:hypothetical protein
MGVNPVDQKYMVLTMHGFSNANYFLTLSFISVVSSMSFWWRDVISEGTLVSIPFINKFASDLFNTLYPKIVLAGRSTAPADEIEDRRN